MVKLNLLPGESVKEYYKEYKKDERNDCGYDLYTAEDVTIEPFDVGNINFNIRCEAYVISQKPLLDENGKKEPYLIEWVNEYLSYFLMPRSSISNTPLVMCNSVGLIDSGYRGEIMARVRNLSSGNYTVRKGTRLFQLVPINNGRGWDRVNIVDTLSESIRGSGGFGSTGK